MSVGHYQLINMAAISLLFVKRYVFLSTTGGTPLKHSQHLADVSLFKDIIITDTDSKEHLQLTHRLQINKAIKAVSSYFKLSPNVSLRSAGWREILHCFLD
jgi:hypothetical protein